MQVGIIGVGLIGGSMAVDLKNRGLPIVLSGLKRCFACFGCEGIGIGRRNRQL